jgi:hypothetical protein
MLENFKIPIIIIVLLFFFCCFAVQTLQVPMFDWHSMKAANNIEVATNMIKHRSFHQYYDYRATFDNPNGDLGYFIGHESPLSVLLLSTTFRIIGKNDLNSRIFIARLFALLHIIIASLLIGLVIFRKNIRGLVLFFSVYLVSFYTFRWSTRPMAEVYSIFYLALFIVSLVWLTQQKFSPYKKALIIVFPSILLCIGGKMNYFLVAGPVVFLYPFMDKTIDTLKQAFRYFLVFIIIGVLTIPLLFIIPGLNEIISWMELGLANGLFNFPKFGYVISTAIKDFGIFVFYGGLVSIIYLGYKFYKFIRSDSNGASPAQTYQMVVFALACGFFLNYFFLRHLYVPHNYYAFSTFFIFSLAFVNLLEEFLDMLLKYSNKLNSIINKCFPQKTIVLSLILLISGGLIILSKFTRDLLIRFGSLIRNKPLDSLKWKDLLLTFGQKLIIIGVILLIVLMFYTIIKKILLLRKIKYKIDISKTLIYVSFCALIIFMVANNIQSVREYIKTKDTLNNYFYAIKKIRSLTKSDEIVISHMAELTFYAERRSLVVFNLFKEHQIYKQENIHYIISTVPIEDDYPDLLFDQKFGKKVLPLVERLKDYRYSDLVYIYRIK